MSVQSPTSPHAERETEQSCLHRGLWVRVRQHLFTGRMGSMLKVTLCVLAIVLARVYVAEFYLVDTPSMIPAIQPTEVFLVDKCSGGTLLPRRFADIPVVNVFTWVRLLRERDAQRDWGLHRSPQFRAYKPGDIILFQMQDDGGETLIKRVHHVVYDEGGDLLLCVRRQSGQLHRQPFFRTRACAARRRTGLAGGVLVGWQCASASSVSLAQDVS